jgi:hypothetical protein
MLSRHRLARLLASLDQTPWPRSKQIRMLAGAAATEESCTDSGADVLPDTPAMVTDIPDTFRFLVGPPRKVHSFLGDGHTTDSGGTVPNHTRWIPEGQRPSTLKVADNLSPDYKSIGYLRVSTTDDIGYCLRRYHCTPTMSVTIILPSTAIGKEFECHRYTIRSSFVGADRYDTPPMPMGRVNYAVPPFADDPIIIKYMHHQIYGCNGTPPSSVKAQGMCMMPPTTPTLLLLQPERVMLTLGRMC